MCQIKEEYKVTFTMNAARAYTLTKQRRTDRRVVKAKLWKCAGSHSPHALQLVMND